MSLRPHLSSPLKKRRTTLTLPADSLTEAQRLARARKVNLSTVFSGQNVGFKEVTDGIWLVSFMDYDLGYFDTVLTLLNNLRRLYIENKASKSRKTNLENFIKIVKKMTLYKLGKTNITISEIKNYYKKMKNIVKPLWIKNNILKLSHNLIILEKL